MFRVKEAMHVHAPADRCFLLSTNVGLVQRTIGMKPVRGVTSGLIHGGDTVVWRGWQFGLPAWHETMITEYDRPLVFTDSMKRGMFKSFQHEHHFEEVDGWTLLRDVVKFSLSGGSVGKQVAKRIVAPHILELMRERFALLKRIAEGKDWEQYVR